ncbi:MAG: M23 family metallopeptidase, partial [Ghiorsea sp.]
VPVLPPFYGVWQVYQGFDGEHTHQAPWQHALDFYITEDQQSYANHGTSAEDYYCYNLPVVSPVEGYVVKALDVLVDNPPGVVDMENNWGNHLLIRMNNGLHLLLAHLKQGSLEVAEGAYVLAGAAVGRCGNSGRSPQPHLHMHVQWGEALGSPTRPFHITTVLHQKVGADALTFQLVARPDEGDSLVSSKADAVLRDSLSLMVGRTFTYAVRYQGQEFRRTLQVVLNLEGQMRLESDLGASAAFTMQDHVLAFYDRQGVEDVFLDVWLLALGLTPLHEGELQWQDQPSMTLFPMSKQQRALAFLCKPLGGGLESSYHRVGKQQVWEQQGKHCLPLLSSFAIQATSHAQITAKLGCTKLTFASESLTLDASLLEVGQHADAGIPAWHAECP